MARWSTYPASIHEDAGLIPGLAWWVKDAVAVGLWCRRAAEKPEKMYFLSSEGWKPQMQVPASRGCGDTSAWLADDCPLVVP